MLPIVRDAEERDVPEIARIYNYSVEHSRAVFTETPATVPERVTWLQARRAAGYPVLVSVVDGQVVGFASFSDFRPWPGYRYAVEHSIYVSEKHQGLGVGSGLMSELFELARALEKRVMIAGVEAGNHASLRFHERLGFVQAGTLPGVGFKFGEFIDLTFLYRALTRNTGTGA